MEDAYGTSTNTYQSKMTPYRVVMPYGCWKVEVEKGEVVEAALISKWAIGLHFCCYKKWVKKKGGTVKRLIPKRKLVLKQRKRTR